MVSTARTVADTNHLARKGVLTGSWITSLCIPFLRLPANIEWKKLNQQGDEVPKGRSGHTLTFVANSSYMLYGGIEDSGNGNIQPNGEVWILNMARDQCKWYKKLSSEKKPLARTQHIALYNKDTQGKVFVFGGHHDPKTRLNDTWYYDVKEDSWQSVGDGDNNSNQESQIGAPNPRANSGATIYNGKVYMFGGHGGLNYSRIAFNDLYSFDLATSQWTKIVPKSTFIPEGRGGHSVFANENKIYIYGGWNSEMQFNNIQKFDLEREEWTDEDIYNGIHRWNHCSMLVEAIPNWKLFIFGGECAEYNEGNPRAFGEYVNSSCYLDLVSGNQQWITYASDSSTYSDIPEPREYAAMAFDFENQRDSKLVIFGGWNNGWFNDLYSLNVSKIVGPAYAITSSEPNLGQLTGKSSIRITGQGFKDLIPKVLFTVGGKPVDTPGKLTYEAVASFTSEFEMTCETPDLSKNHNSEIQCVVQIQIQGGDLSTTWIPFTFFLNTKAQRSLAYGPGLLCNCAVGHPVEFVIQARNDKCENRQSGRDHFKVMATRVKEKVEAPPKLPVEGEEGYVPVDADAEDQPPAPIVEESAAIEVEIIDNYNGTYSCKYQTDQESSVKIQILFENEKNELVNVRGSPYVATFIEGVKPSDNLMTGGIMDKHIKKELDRLTNNLADRKKSCSKNDKDIKDVKVLLGIKEATESVIKSSPSIQLEIDQLDESLKLFTGNKQGKDAQLKTFINCQKQWTEVQTLAKNVKKEIEKDVQRKLDENNSNINNLEESITQFSNEMKKREFFQYKCGVNQALEKLDGVFVELKGFEEQIQNFGENSVKFGNPSKIDKAVKDIDQIKVTVDNMKLLWDHINCCTETFQLYMKKKWLGIQPYEMEDEVKKLQKTLKDMKCDKRCNAYLGIIDEIKKWLIFLPLIAELADKDMRDRHWNDLKQKIKAEFTIDENLILKDIYELNLGKYQEDVEEITDQARQEAKMEKTLAKLEEAWKDICFEFTPHKDSGVQLIKLSEENFDMLEENQQSVNAMFSSRYLSTFEESITSWQKNLSQVSEIVVIVSEVQRSWSFLENLFIHSDEVKKELPKESQKFIQIDSQVREILAECYKKQKCIDFSTQDHVLPSLEKNQEDLTVCEKALNEFMDSKRMAFPRFYFVSPADLLDILSNGNNPAKVMVHMPKIISAMDMLELKEQGVRPYALGMHAGVGKEYVKFTEEKALMGKVEVYLQDIIDLMRNSLRDIAKQSLKNFGNTPKPTWLLQDPAQVTLLINVCSWVQNVEKAFLDSATNKDSVKEAYKVQDASLKDLILLAQGDLERPVRQKIMCLITMDAHSRDIIDILDKENVCKSDEFQWQTQLKGVFDAGKEDFVFRIADACLDYGYEYLGNGARLVITPLTDRIYVTATQALHLKMGCAPAGPAGTGKTESTKDLACALGKACYVFNCSDQMDYKGMAGIFKGLASSGSWGCFDEFNRLVPEVLSVCSVQFKSVTDAVRDGLKRFTIEGVEISLDPTCGAFITMNPGYLGRSELPEGLKALFRPITVVVPDLRLICENMLMAEGFVDAKILAKKFVTLYFLCRDLLSKSDHYDWGLRAIKSVLVVAGVFKRAEPQLEERAILMRALRDFNIPKIIAADEDIFANLLKDLFPGINPLRKRDMRFEKIIEDVTIENRLHPDDNFILKIVQLGELLEIRHCVFVMGPPGCGKSETWKMLAKANDKDNRKTTWTDLNPKVTSTNELYGVVLLATREWKDGLMSYTMRNLGNIPNSNPKWIILDGDLDANWIESMNSVMDDNRLLTLASNERIPLKPHMKLIFEIRDLRFATPATVSRAGILFISDSDGSQWRSYVKSWIKTQSFEAKVKEELQEAFDKFLPELLLHCLKTFKHIIPQKDISMVIAICKLLENIMNKNEVNAIVKVFIFACIWCIGGGYSTKDGVEYRSNFSTWFKDKFKSLNIFKGKGSCFDFFVDYSSSNLEEWSKMTTSDIVSTIDTSKAIPNYTIPTPETISTTYLMRQFVQINHSPLLVGIAGCGKTQIIKGLLNEMTSTGEEYLQQIINFNYYTDANLLQMNLEQFLEKKAGKTYAPKGKFKLIYFIDDMNMPARDPYDTQNAIALLRQHRDYEHWYDKNKLTVRDIKNTQLISAMNPYAGSFVVNPRLQRHFWLSAVGMPTDSSLTIIYTAFLNKHFSKFPITIQGEIQSVIKATLQIHGDAGRLFKKTAANFHYEFNVRHLTNVFQGLLTAKQDAIKGPENFVKLWIHECERIYGDRLVNYDHLNLFKAATNDICNKSFSKYSAQTKKYFGPTAEPLVFANFVAGLDDKLYDQFPNQETLNLRLAEGLREYNDTNAVMDLVLFDDAMKHVCKISRIISAAQGHALLIGVGGSGKQSLSRLSSFVCQFSTVGIVISSSYGMNDLKEDLKSMYMKSGGKNEGLMFLFTEGQITKEQFLVYINDLLSSGEIADLFAIEDIDGIVNNIRPAVKGEGIIDSKENCWKYFIDRVKANLHMALCFSPGDSLRNRAKKFPALVNSTVIDWFHPWPEEALLSVASKFLAEVEMSSDEIRIGIEQFMPFSFSVVNQFSLMILEKERRYVYTTPKSFLELIKLFKVMQMKKEGELIESKEIYETGVIRLTETGEKVSKLEEELKLFSVEVEFKKKSADEQAEIVGAEKIKVEAQNDIAEMEAKKCTEIKDMVQAKMSSVQKDLDEAIPLVEKAQAALKGLKIEDFRLMKALKNPPPDIAKTFTCVLHLLCGTEFKDVNIPVDKNGKLKTENAWKTCLSSMAKPDCLMDALNGLKDLIDTQQLAPSNFKAIRPTLAEETFTVENLKNKSECAGGLCDFILNIVKYYDVVESVEPKRNAVKESQEQLEAANTKKAQVDALVADLNAKLAVLIADFDKAMNEKDTAMAEAAKCEKKLDLAQRLVGALGSELDRWSQSIIDLGDYLKLIIGDVLLASAFVSYVGPFNKTFRDQIMTEFVKFFAKNNIPMSPEANPLAVLTDEATVAGWNTFKLPPDRVSTENGAILINSERYPLIIDPQLQGINWLKKTWDAHGLEITRLSNPKMVRTIEMSIENGNPVLIENLDNAIDAVIQPVYSRAIVKRGKSKYIKMGDKELQLNPKFVLYLHTKLSNPHYQPEIQAECTLINFTVTENGLEDQLLSLVVKKERPDLAAQNEELIQQQNDFKIKLKELEKDLLKQLAEAEGDILENITLIENLEFSKKLSTEISEKVEIAKEIQIGIAATSENYRPAAERGALVFFLMNELYKIHSFYKFSLDSFIIVVSRAIDIVAERMNPKKADKAIGEAAAEGAEGEAAEAQPEANEDEDGDDAPLELSPEQLVIRVNLLSESITFQGFNYTRRGTLEADKMIIATMLTFRIMIRQGKISQEEVNALVKKEVPIDTPNQPESLKQFLPDNIWAACKGLESVNTFSNICQQMEQEAPTWRKWYSDIEPELTDLPKSVKDISLFHRILLLRALRPDRLINALKQFVKENMGIEFVEQPSFDMAQTYTEMDVQTPIFFVLFPGVDPTPDVEKIGKTMGKLASDRTFINISMGQGQEETAIQTLKEAGKNGNWVMFQNVHLMQTWMKSFERNLEIVIEDGAHPDFRVFVSSEPPGLPHQEIIPESILQNALKIANEAPTDLKSNIRRAYSKFDESQFEKAKSHKFLEYKALLMGLCMYHSLILGRRKFGAQGWSRKYTFNDGDLSICGDILHNYLTNYEKVPYADLRYLYGEVMYGGHITDGWDRRTNNTYLDVLIKPEIMNGMQMTCTFGFRAPDPAKFDRDAYVQYVEEKLPAEVPAMFGLHANAEIGYLTFTGEKLFNTIQSCQGGSAGGSGGGKDEKVTNMINIFLEKIPVEFDMIDMFIRAKDKSPFVVVCLQECERMNFLLFEIKKSLEELMDGMLGKLNMTDNMEDLGARLFVNQAPPSWNKVAYPSLKNLADWFVDLIGRCDQLVEYQTDLIAPKSLWISALFNPMSFLTAIKQVTARNTGQSLDDMVLQTDIINTRNPDEITEAAESGAFIHGFFLEGASWELGRGTEQGYLTEMLLKDLHPILPVMHVTAIVEQDQQITGRYLCPAYLTTMRGGTFVFDCLLAMEQEDSDHKIWILAGVALLMAPE